MPRNIVIASTAIATSVAAAFFASGGRNAGTPFETASTPVIAVQPLANAVSSRKVVSGCGAGRVGGSGASTGTIVCVDVAIQPVRNQHEDADDEKIGRHGEDAARFADAAQVADHQQRQEDRGTSRRGTRRGGAPPT